MRRIVRSEAVCLRVQDYHESSKLVTFFTLEHGKVNCLAKGARRLKSKFGAALDLFAQSRIIYYSHETRTLLTLSDAELVHSFSSLALVSERFLAAEQMAEFALRVIQPLDPSPHLYQLLLNYLSTLESLQNPVCSLQSSGSANLQSSDSAILHFASCTLNSPHTALVCSFLLKAASFLGFRPELRRCLICRRPADAPRITLDASRAGLAASGVKHRASGVVQRAPSAYYFDPGRGGIICPRCAVDKPSGTRLDPASLNTLAFLLYTPVSDIAHVFSVGPQPANETNRQERQDSSPENLQSTIYNLQSPLDLVLGFLGHHFDPLVLNSFHWHARLERNV